MKKIFTSKDLQKLHDIPQEVQRVIADIVESLDANYGKERDDDTDGGYVAVIEYNDDLVALREELGMDLEDDLYPEYVTTITTGAGDIFTNTLLLCNNDFGVSVIMPLSMTPKYLKEYILE